MFVHICCFLLATSNLYCLTVLDKLFLGSKGDSITWNLRGNQTELSILEKNDSEITLLEKPADDEPHMYHIQRDHSTQERGFIPTLLRLKLTPIPEKAKRRAGPPPMPGELDVRSIWNPQIIVNDKSYFLPCSAFAVQWPSDGSDLAGKRGTLYYAPPPGTPAFPYWIEIETAPNPVHIRTIRSHAGI